MAVFRSDPCGIVCLIVTYGAVLYADYVVVRHLVVPVMSETISQIFVVLCIAVEISGTTVHCWLWGMVNVCVFNIIVFLITVSHMRAVLSDPGIVPLPSTGLDFSDLHAGKKMPNMRDGWTVCMKCETYRPPRAHHCRICRRCIRRMDHHCPWINNCVGELNQKFFIQFLFYVGLASCYATTMVIVSWVLDPGLKGNHKHIKMIHSVLLIVVSILFGMFVLAIGCDQMSAILNDETAVEHIKKEGPKRQKKSTYVLLQEVFGRGHPVWWLCPLQFNPVNQDYQPQYIV